tara:strand:- start:45 stop:359 length:315 start_codon:yes stop_codon:yes gene_type:complete
MKKEKNIMSYTAKELKTMRDQGQSKTDWEKVDNITDLELEDAIKSDPDSDAGVPQNWVVGMPPLKEKISINIDKDVLKWFRGKGKGYQSYINNILRSYVSMQKE